MLQLNLLSLYLHKPYHGFILRTKSICTADVVLLHCCGKISLLGEVWAIFFFKCGSIFMSTINTPCTVDSFVDQQLQMEGS